MQEGARWDVFGEHAPEGVPGHLLGGREVLPPEHAQLRMPQHAVAALHATRISSLPCQPFCTDEVQLCNGVVTQLAP